MNHGFLRQIEQLIRPIKVRVANSIARAVVQVVDDSTKMQLLQLGVLAGEEVEDVENFGTYGFNSVPKVGAEAVVVFPNGDRAHGLVVAVGDRRFRPKDWQPGEVGMHTDEAGHVVRLMRGKKTVFGADDLRLGSDGASDEVVRKSDLQAVITAVQAHTHTYVVGSGITATGLPVLPAATASAKVKAD